MFKFTSVFKKNFSTALETVKVVTNQGGESQSYTHNPLHILAHNGTGIQLEEWITFQKYTNNFWVTIYDFVKTLSVSSLNTLIYVPIKRSHRIQ